MFLEEIKVNNIEHVYDDGGRAQAGFKGKTRDCVVRAISIATELDYMSVYNAINELAQTERIGKRKKRKSSARTGVYTPLIRKYMASKGWHWIPIMQIGSGCKAHLRAEELPAGRIIVKLSRHCAAVIDGVLHDTYDCSRGGTRCVYGYWTNTAEKQR